MEVNNQFKDHEVKGLLTALKAKRRNHKKGIRLDLQQHHEVYSQAVAWSPRKLREGRAWAVTKRQEAD
jgi:hypothetical protein